MSFTNPEILFGLFAVLIPVIVHLFNFRRYKKIYFSNISLLKDISIETKKQNQLKHIIVMIIRMLAIAILILAFSGPNFNNKDKSNSASQNITGIYIDNSFSMEAGNRNGRLFDHAVAETRELIKRSSRDSKFLILNNNNSSTQRTLNKDEALSQVDNISINAKHKEASSIMEEFIMFKTKNHDFGLNTYIFSDFQKSSFYINDINDDSLINWNLVFLKHNETNNILIDSCWIEEPVILQEKITSLYVRLRNVSEKSYEKAAVKLFINDKNKSISSVDLEANSSQVIKMQFNAGENGWKSAYIEIEDYPITFDDILYFTFKVENKINVLAINSDEEDRYLNAFYSSDSTFNLVQQNYKSIDYQKLIDNQLIILNGLSDISTGLISQLNTYVKKGGNLIIIPPKNDLISDFNLLLRQFNAGSFSGPIDTETRVKGVKLTNSIFTDAIEKIPENTDLPIIFRKFNYKKTYTNQLETIISLLNGDDLLVKKEVGEGLIYILSINLSPSFSNISSHALFIPLMYGSAIEGKNRKEIFYTIGSNTDININISETSNLNKDGVFSIEKERPKTSFIPLQQLSGNNLRISLRDNITEAANYRLVQNREKFGLLAFNYNRLESIMEFHTYESLSESLKNSNIKNYQIINLQSETDDEVINSMENESLLWLLFIIFALSFLLMEILVLRFWP